MGAYELFTQETNLSGETRAQFNSLLNALAPVAYWRETYAETKFSGHFRKIWGLLADWLKRFLSQRSNAFTHVLCLRAFIICGINIRQRNFTFALRRRMFLKRF